MDNFIFLNEVTLSAENNTAKVQVIRVGNFRNGDVKITKKDLLSMKKNFYANARRQKFKEKPALPVNYFHDMGGIAAGWIKEIYIENDGMDLFADIEFTPKGAEKIRSGELKYISAELDYNYADAETGEKFGMVLTGAGLTNIPEVRDMKEISLSEFTNFNNNKEDKIMDKSQILEAIKGLSEDDQKAILSDLGAVSKSEIDSIKTELSEVQGKLVESKKELKEKSANLSEDQKEKIKLSETVKELSEKIALNEKEKKFEKMLSEGKACEAQRKAFLADDFEEFANNAAKKSLNLSEDGNPDDNQISDEDEAFNKLDELAEKKMKDNTSLSYKEATLEVIRENPELKKAL